MTVAERQRLRRERLRGPDKIIARGAAEIKRQAKRLRAAEAPLKHAAQLAAIAARANPLDDTSVRYPVIYADPAWRFEPWSRETGMDRAADNHYKTMTAEEICALPVRDLAAEDAVLYLWATMPMLPAALKVIEAWGFTYRSGFSWHKDKIGTGYWNRNQHELLLVATRGKIPAPPPEARVSSVIESPRGRHSEKPDSVYEMIEHAYPGLPKIELFARASRDGWAAHGDELGLRRGRGCVSLAAAGRMIRPRPEKEPSP